MLKFIFITNKTNHNNGDNNMTTPLGSNPVDQMNIEATMAAKPKASSSISASKIMYKVANVALKVFVALGLALTLGLPLISKTVRNFSEDLFFGVQNRPTTYNPEKEAKRKAQFLAKHEESFETTRIDLSNNSKIASGAGKKIPVDAAEVRQKAYKLNSKGGVEPTVLDQAARVGNEAREVAGNVAQHVEQHAGWYALGAAALTGVAVITAKAVKG